MHRASRSMIWIAAGLFALLAFSFAREIPGLSTSFGRGFLVLVGIDMLLHGLLAKPAGQGAAR